MRKIYIHTVLCATLLASYSCNNQQSSAETKDSTAVTAEASVPVTFKDSKADSIYQGYISLKNALVANNEEDAKQASANLEGILKTTNDSLAAQAGKISAAATVADKRLAFNDFTENILKEIRTKVSGGTIYKQHCPMANDGKGGFWLASEKEIKNPYYGEAMLSCGTVEEEIK
ncbi:DUF3347 domain-containing protein [Pedobacter puniceum]|uniref:DUF3347 domain-containing protein n=1 Tax=Pedobacter puniceum TaxID=2666136 RepID=A0A7K0FJK5_9SPHI|nr:DUF3347 domain-containing protein [Pedobacter puniceum]MRX46159.1 DUF3347 domain-containing protein [Pedobacter puniceum]